jgi:hypothetical protein
LYQDSESFFSHASSISETTKTYDSPLFKGAAIKFNDLSTADTEAKNLLALSSVKKVWPNRVYSLPETEVVWTGTPESGSLSKRQDDNTTDTFSPHVMTQVDKLRAQGIVGTGIKIGVIDTGVSCIESRLNEPC